MRGNGQEATGGVPPIETRPAVVLIGIGNPGPRYEATRHNIGFLALDEIARQLGIEVTRRAFDGLYGTGVVGGRRWSLLKPQTYVNLSGRSVAQLWRFLKLERGGLVVLHDDIDIPFGRVRLKWAGGNGGHKGLRSIDAELGTADYFRVRLGVGRPSLGSVTDHVLSAFSPQEREQLPDVIAGGVQAVRALIDKGLKEAQNTVHGSSYYTAVD